MAGHEWIVRLAVGLVLLAVQAGYSSAQPVGAYDLEHFRYERTITFSDPDAVHPDTLLMSSLWSLDVAADGRMLVVDMRGRQAFLFDSEGRLQALLDPSVCHPGPEVIPKGAKFLGEQLIFLIDFHVLGYQFSSEGDCLGRADPNHPGVVTPDWLAAGPGGSLVGLYQGRDGPLLRVMDANGLLVDEIALPAYEYPRASRGIAAVGLVADGSHIYYAGTIEPYILKLTRDGRVVDRIEHRDRWLRPVNRDWPASRGGSIQETAKALRRFWARYTFTTQINELSDRMLMVHYANPLRGVGYQVFTKSGQLVAQQLGHEARFIHAGGGLAYRAVYPDSDETPNPYIEVYRFVPPE